MLAFTAATFELVSTVVSSQADDPIWSAPHVSGPDLATKWGRQSSATCLTRRVQRIITWGIRYWEAWWIPIDPCSNYLENHIKVKPTEQEPLTEQQWYPTSQLFVIDDMCGPSRSNPSRRPPS